MMLSSLLWGLVACLACSPCLGFATLPVPGLGKALLAEQSAHSSGDAGSATLNKYDKAVVAYAEAGEWRKASLLLQKMQEKGVTPAIIAYVSTITSCRKALMWDRGEKLLQDMYAANMPEDLFDFYAAPGPGDATSTQTQRVFSLLLFMRQDNLEPNIDTYRAVMALCSKEGLWHMSLLLLQHAREAGADPGKFIYDEVCKVLDEAGHKEIADMVYEQAQDEQVFSPWVTSGTMDLHEFTVSTARAAVRSVLDDMVRRPTTRQYHDCHSTLNIITGKGNRSEQGIAVLKPAMLALLQRELKLSAGMHHSNEGCITIKGESLLEWVAQREGAGAQVPKGVEPLSQDAQ